jgi:hypothetical protein
MSDVFTFDKVVDLDDYTIEQAVKKVSFEDLAKALIGEDAKLRKKFYRNIRKAEDLQALSTVMMDTGRYTVLEKGAAQGKILSHIGDIPEYHDYRFQNGFQTMEAFESFLTERRLPEQPYGIFDKEVSMCRFFESDTGENILADIERKNEEQGMGNVTIPHTNIKLINYSVCPKCGTVFSINDLAEYYANPKPDSAFKNPAEQFRHDTRVCCHECETWFLPTLVISDGTPKNEVQFLCRIQTMQAIEAFYKKKGIKVLSAKKDNVLKKEYPSAADTVQNDGGSVMRRTIFHTKRPRKLPKKPSGKRFLNAIRNDVLLKEMESKPTLISNLLQYTPADLAINLIDGTNCRKSDVLFGVWG